MNADEVTRPALWLERDAADETGCPWPTRSADRGRADPLPLGRRLRYASPRLRERLFVQRGMHDLGDPLLPDARLASATGPHPAKALQALVAKALTPCLDRRRAKRRRRHRSPCWAARRRPATAHARGGPRGGRPSASATELRGSRALAPLGRPKLHKRVIFHIRDKFAGRNAPRSGVREAILIWKLQRLRPSLGGMRLARYH